MNINEESNESTPTNSQRSNESSISDELVCQVVDNPNQECNKKSKLKGGTSSKKDSSGIRHSHEVEKILKSNCNSDDKLKLISNKYSEIFHSHRKLKTDYKLLEEKLIKISRENEQNQQQRSKAVLARSRLENLCRELQKLNKAQKEEIDLKLRLEEEKRKEISATFQSAFAEMNSLTNQNTEINTKMREENLEMRETIKSVRERIEISEQQLEKVRQQAQLELQLAEAKMATVKMEMTAEKECLLKEKQQLLLKLTEYQVKISELQATEAGLRGQISMFTEKYDDFQNALTKSNEVFNGFNEEMEKMSKKIVKLEKETCLWKQRWEKSHAALLQMAADKQMRDAEMEKQNQKIALLQKLCKAFQSERAELLSQLKTSNNNTTNSNSTSKIIKNDDVDIKQINELSEDCQKLKSDLAQLQGSLNETILEENLKKEPLASENIDIDSKTETNEKPSENSDKNEVNLEENLIKENSTDVENKVEVNLNDEETNVTGSLKEENSNEKIELNSPVENNRDDLIQCNQFTDSLCNNKNEEQLNPDVCTKTNEPKDTFHQLKNDECIINGSLTTGTNGELKESQPTQLNGNSIPNESNLVINEDVKKDEVDKHEKNSQDLVDEDKKDLNAKQKAKKGKDKKKKKNF